MLVHTCKEAEQCEGMTPQYSYPDPNMNNALRNAKVSNHGPAIKRIVFLEEVNEWAVDNNEYTNVICFCPFCGVNLKELSNFAKAIG